MLPARTKLFVMPYRNDDVAYDIHDFWRKQYNFDFSSLTLTSPTPFYYLFLIIITKNLTLR